jgi:AcrR family transcriptional regulator
MSPRLADPKIRTALVETAARILAAEGPESLSIRKLAAEVGASTMAVYTHFGGKDELLGAVVLEGFDRLATHLAAIDESDDPVFDLCLLGAAYRRNALDNPHLYAAMFGRPIPKESLTDDELVVPLGTFETLVRGCQRCIDAEALDAPDAEMLANQFWAAAHGVVMLELSGCFIVGAGGDAILSALARNLLLGMSPDRARTGRSVAAAVDVIMREMLG